MFNPINAAFKKAKQEKRPALLTYTVAGDSTKKQSLDILKSISKNADILEVGMPHNTPVADGSQIQTSAYRAIKNGIKINDIFKIVKDFKKFDNSKPVILMGYYNMIFQFGENKFLKVFNDFKDIIDLNSIFDCSICTSLDLASICDRSIVRNSYFKNINIFRDLF